MKNLVMEKIAMRNLIQKLSNQKLSTSAEKLLKQRYYKPNETWADLVKRNVEAICTDETKAAMYALIFNRVFLPASPCLVNAGYNNGLFPCFTVGPTQDTLEDGFATLGEIAQVAKKGGGCGFTGSILRPKNAPVAGSVHGYAYGPNRFAEMVSYAMDAITQSGFRKMALMYTLSAEHPDIEEFIGLKQSGNEAACYNFNQSVMAKDSFLNKAMIDPTSKEGKLFDKICKHAWANGEPGFLFEDTINSNNTYEHTDQYILTTNPCLTG